MEAMRLATKTCTCIGCLRRPLSAEPLTIMLHVDHLILQTGSHSDSGIMRDTWEPNEMRTPVFTSTASGVDQGQSCRLLLRSNSRTDSTA